ncbi:MAG: ABC transporter ATP-binding protein [Litorimonas sp.]
MTRKIRVREQDGKLQNLALSLQNVYLTLPAISGPVNILRGVDLSVKSGESLAIIGPSGSGKSSLISMSSGLEKPTSGDVFLLGQKINTQSEDQLARLRRGRVSMVFQSFHLLPTMTAYDNVRVPLEIAKLDNIDARAQNILQDVGLGDRLHHYPGQLSGGERQRVAIARALASDPELVFADEPTGNLDQKTGQGVADMLFDIAKMRGTTLILVTHDLTLAQRADRIVTMNNGLLEDSSSQGRAE